MHALVSLLDPGHHQAVEAIWERLARRCGLSGIRKTPIPHFSWRISRSMDFEKLEEVLEQLSSNLAPLQVWTAGLDSAAPFCDPETGHYAPATWVPHITLAHVDLDETKLACAVRLLAREKLAWKILIDNLALIRQDPGRAGKVAAAIAFNG